MVMVIMVMMIGMKAIRRCRCAGVVVRCRGVSVGDSRRITMRQFLGIVVCRRRVMGDSG